MSEQSYLKKWFGRKSLTQEVIEVFDSVVQLRKLGHNDEDDYDYLRIIDLCDAFKGELFQRGILFIATDRDRTFEQISDVDGKFLERCTVLTEFAAIRERERVDLGASYGSAQDHSDKALAIAQTAAFKAFLKRSSMTYGEEDEPENKRDSLTPKESVRVASYQRRAWDAAMRDSGLTPDQVSTSLSEMFDFSINCENIPDLPRREFDTAIKWLLNRQDLTAQWSAAVEQLKTKRGPQPIVGAAEMNRRDEMEA